MREEDVRLNVVDDGDVVRAHGILGLAGAGARELPRNPQKSGPLSALLTGGRSRLKLHVELLHFQLQHNIIDTTHDHTPKSPTERHRIPPLQSHLPPPHPYPHLHLHLHHSPSTTPSQNGRPTTTPHLPRNRLPLPTSLLEILHSLQHIANCLPALR